MAKLSEIVAFLDTELRTDEVPDYPGAHNGLQLENGGEVTKVATAVDASLKTIEKAVADGADLLVVHHGLFWQGVRMLTGGQYRKMKTAIEGGLAIYSSHIPLDIHPTLGNNALLASRLGLEVSGQFLPWKGIQMGLVGEWSGTWEELETKVEEEVGEIISTVRSGSKVGRLGIITGGAGSEVEAVRECGIDCLLTGEGPHWSFPLAEELGLSVIHAGHYATETFGVGKLGEILAQKFGLDSRFLSLPTGL